MEKRFDLGIMDRSDVKKTIRYCEIKACGEKHQSVVSMR
jgi:hypothetical protein